MKKSEHNLRKAKHLGGHALPTIYRQLKPAEFAQAMKVRLQVFVEEQKVPFEEEYDCYDEVAQHFGVFYDGKLVGTGRLVFQEQCGKIGRVAILPEYRGRGFGSNLIQMIIATGREQGLEEFVLGAQLQAMDFYARLGFIAEGDVFLDGGIPHRTMRVLFNSDQCQQEAE